MWELFLRVGDVGNLSNVHMFQLQNCANDNERVSDNMPVNVSSQGTTSDAHATLQHDMLLTVLLEDGLCQYEDVHKQQMSRCLDTCQAL